MDDQEIKRTLEALLLVTEKSLLVDQVRQALGSNEVQPSEIRARRSVHLTASANRVTC